MIIIVKTPSKDFVGLCGLKKMVRLNQKSWFGRKKVLGQIFIGQKVFLNGISLSP